MVKIVILMATLALFIAGCYGPSTPAAPPTTASPTIPAPGPVSEISADIASFAFKPQTITISPGTRVTWTNKDGVPHTVTARNGSFDSGTMVNGGTYSRVFDQKGSYDYYCAIHPLMTATVVVQ